MHVADRLEVERVEALVLVLVRLIAAHVSRELATRDTISHTILVP